MKINILFIGICFLGCTELPDVVTSKETENNNQGIEYRESNNQSKIVSYYDEPIIKNVNHYVKWLTQDLFSNIDIPNNREIFIVSDIALLDSDLNKTNHFGRQVTEAIIHEVNRTGFSVIDMKTSGFMRMTEAGDLFFQTEDYQEMAQATNARNIITGTMTRHRGGYLINLRAVVLESRMLISSAQILVPHDVVDSVLEEDVLLSPEELTSERGMPIKAYRVKE